MDQDTDRFIRATRGNANPLDDVEQKLRHTIFGQERAIEAVVRENGLERRYYCKTLFWQVIVYTR